MRNSDPRLPAHPGKLVAWIVAAALFAPAVALSASGFEIDCHNRGTAPAVEPIDDLDLTVVDLSTPETTLPEDAPLVVDADAGSAPVLNLGPRVATQVRDIFGASALEESLGASPLPDPRSATMAPLAEIVEDSNSGTPLVDAEGDSDDSLPYSPLRVHREMYRTDI